MKALTKDSKHLSDLKDVKFKEFGELAKNRKHVDFFCKDHMRDRLRNYCNQDSLVDIIMTVKTSLKFSSVTKEYANQKCQSCTLMGEFRIEREY